MAETETKRPILSRLSPPRGSVRTQRRKGRGPGSGLGKTSGKGQKGQKARQPGNFHKTGFEGGQTPLQRRLPKYGFWNPFRITVATVNVRDLSRFTKGSVVDEESLRKAGLVKGNCDRIKLLGQGDVAKALTVRVHGYSASAKEKIEKAGGKAEVLTAPAPSA